MEVEDMLRDKRLQIVNEYADAVLDYGQDHPYTKSLSTKFRTFDAFVYEFFELTWNTKELTYMKPVLKDSEN